MILNSSQRKLTPDQVEERIIQSLYLKRITFGISQKQIAELMGTKQSLVSRFERGKHHPSLNFILRYAEALELEAQIKFV